MNQPIVFTPADVVWLAGAIVAISAAVKVVVDAIGKLRRPNQTQDDRLDALERRLKSDFERLRVIDEGNAITQRALLALLSHGIDGNDVESMKKAKEELTDYLIDR